MAKIIHYASLMQGTDEVFGVATLVAGGYLFRSDANPRQAVLVDARNADLMLFGRVDLATEQYLADELAGGPAAVACSRDMGRQ